MYSLVKYLVQRKWSKVENEDSSDIGREDDNTIKNDPTPTDNVESITNEVLPDDDLEQLRNECPNIFLSNHRSVLGYIIDVKEDTLVVDIKIRKLLVNLSVVKSECNQEIGDCVYVQCHVENEELFSGDVVETLEPLSIAPSSKKKNQKCTVKEIQPECVILSSDCYIGKSVLKKHENIKLNVGEALHVDMVECELEKFKWRCIYFAPYKCPELTESRRRSKNIRKNRLRQAKPEDTKRIVLPNPSGHWNNYQNKLCEYANNVWSQEIGEIIPGVRRCTHRRFRAVRIPHYDVPYNIRITYLTQYNRHKVCHSELERLYPCLKEDLSYKNYGDRFQALLWLEEVELFKNFRKFDTEKVKFNRESECLSMTITNLGERRPSLVIGDKVRAFPIKDDSKDISETQSNSKPTCFEGIVHNVLCDKIFLKFHKIFYENYKDESYRLEFYFSRLNIRRKHYAIKRAVSYLGKDFLFPENLIMRDSPQLDICFDEQKKNMLSTESIIKWYNPNLNFLQRSTVFNILRGEVLNMPYIIYGPPGTGKTITLVECILQIVSNLPHSRLLVATPSNSAANLICSRLIESQGLHLGELVRLVSFNLIERDQIPENLLKYCATLDCGDDGTYEEEMYVTQDGIQMNCPMRMLAPYRVTIGTCSTLGKYLEMGLNSEHFTHVIVDEAGQCSEPEIMIPLSQVSKTRGQVILAGDPMQLPAIVVNKYSDDCGLSTSFLERIMNSPPYRKDAFAFENSAGFNPILITKLRKNYRSLPSILRIYNYLFYDLELKATIDTEDSPEVKLLGKLDKVLFPSTKRPPSHGAFFYAVRGENVRERDSPSWCNPREANVVYRTTIALYRAGLSADDIGIITPYMKQVKLIRGLFMETTLPTPKIGSVEEFQGQERNVILLSTVRTAKREVVNYDWRYGLGFVKSERRLNVAISRARALLIVFGDADLLKLDQCWGIYVGDCRFNDSFFGQIDKDETNEIDATK